MSVRFSLLLRQVFELSEKEAVRELLELPEGGPMAAALFLCYSFRICKIMLAGGNPHGVTFDQRDCSQMRKVVFLVPGKIHLDSGIFKLAKLLL